MANEFQLTSNLVAKNGAFQDRFSPGTINIDQSTIGRGGHAQVISIADDNEVDFGDISNAGWCTLQNLDDTNFVEYGPNSGGAMIPFGKLLPGEYAVLRLSPSIVMRAQADTAPVKLDVTVYEN